MRERAREDGDDVRRASSSSSSSSTAVRGERRRRLALAAASAASVWASSLSACERAVDFARGGRGSRIDGAHVRGRHALREFHDQRVGYESCVTRAMDGCARRDGEELRARAEPSSRAGDANAARVRALKIKSRRCSRAMRVLGDVMARVHEERSRETFAASFWTETCADANPTLNPKRAVLVAMKTTDDGATATRLRLVNMVYVAAVNASVANVLQNVHDRASYDASYVDLKTRRLQAMSDEARALAMTQYEHIYNASANALESMTISSHGALDAISAAAIGVSEDASTLVDASAQAASDFAASAQTVVQYTQNVISKFEAFRDFVSIVQTSGLMDSTVPLPDLSMPTLQMHVPEIDVGALEFASLGGLNETIDFAAQIANASKEAASESMRKILDEAAVVDIGASLSLPTVLDDYDPPPYKSGDEYATQDVDSFDSRVFNRIATASDAFEAMINASISPANDVLDFAGNLSVNMSSHLPTPNVSTVPRAPSADDFNFLGIPFETLNLRMLFSTIDGAFAGLKHIDWTYRVIRCVQIVAKHLAYGELELEPLNLTERGNQVKGRKVRTLERIARVFSDPLVVSSAKFAIFSAVVAAILHIYRQTHQKYVDGCVDSRNGTFTGNNAFSLARSYVNSKARAHAVAYDSYAQFNATHACEAYTTANIERFNAHDIERRDHEQTLIESQIVLRATQTCVADINSTIYNGTLLSRMYSRAQLTCASESFALDTNVTLECQPTQCSALNVCVGPLDEVLWRQSIETGCAFEEFAHNVVQRFVVLLLAYVSINVAREPLVLALNRVVTSVNPDDAVACVAHYNRSSDDITVRSDAREVVEHALWQYRMRAFVVVAACCVAQTPWLALAEYFSN